MTPTANTMLKKLSDIVHRAPPKKAPQYKLAEDVHHSTILANDKDQDEDIFEWAGLSGIKKEVDGWQLVDKAAVKRGMALDQEETDVNEWDFVDDEHDIRNNIEIL